MTTVRTDLKAAPSVTSADWAAWERDEWPKWQTWRNERFHERKGSDDQRDPGARDRDRVLYSSALRRMAGVTQVVDVDQGHLFHNRLTHTIKVEQVSRRLAEHLVKKHPRLWMAIGGLDPEVVAAAALAHDLGHPPFGHIAENELDRLLGRADAHQDGYEGNAQTFRIVTKLAVRYEETPGLNLTRATLNAVLKYPWLRMWGGERKAKFGAFTTELAGYNWTRSGVRWQKARTVEAELMDLADDITYSVHDVEDFYRAGLIPLERLVSQAEQDRFTTAVFARWEAQGKAPKYSQTELAETFSEVMDLVPQALRDRPYDGTRAQRAAVRTYTASLIARYVMSVSLRVPDSVEASGDFEFVVVPKEHLREIAILKELTRQYVVNNPALAAQQHGQRRIIRDLFSIFLAAIGEKEHDLVKANPALLPFSAREVLAAVESDWERARIAADLVAGLTEQQALGLHKRLCGFAFDSVRNTIVH